MTTHENDVASLFDPRSTGHIPVVPPGALPPSWAAARTAAPPDHHEPTPQYTPDVWDEPEPVETDDRTASIPPADEIPDEGRGRRRGRGKSRKSARAKKSETIKAQERAARTVAKDRKSVKLELCGTAGHITRTPRTATAWFVQPPGPWNMRPTPKQRRYIRDEALILANLREAGVEHLHRRLTRAPWPVRAWARSHHEWATPLPDVDGALSWNDYLRGQQHGMLWSEPTIKGRYWGIELPARSMSSRGLDYLALWLSGFGRIGAAVTRWADESFDRETAMLDEHLATLARIMAARGADARPATAGQMDYLLRRSAAIGLPLDIDGVISGGGDWTDTDIASLEDLADLSLTPGDGFTTVSGLVDGRRYSAAVIILTIGRMAPMPIPEQMLPWQVIGDGSGEPLEWSERITLEEKTATARAMRFVTDKITNQFKHYTVEHDESPPTELQEQHAAAQKIKTQLEHDHSGLSTRVKGWWRMAVVGANADEVRRKVSTLQEMYSPHIILEHEHGQYQLLREFIPGQRQANIAHARRMSVYDASAGMAAVGDRIGDRTGLIVGQTASIAPRPAVWNCFAGPENKDKSGLTPIVAVPGSGKTFLAGMTVYQAVRAGAYGVILDPSGPLARLATLPELAPFTRVYALTGRSRPGALNPYRVIADPDPDDPEYSPTHSHYALDPDPAAAAADQYQADLRAAAAERMECAVSVLKMMLTDKDVEQRWTESVLHTAAHNVGGDADHHLGQVLDQLAAMAENEQDTEVKTTARSIHQKLHIMSQLAEARVLFPKPGTLGGFDADTTFDERLTILTMPGLQLPPEGVPSSQWTPQQRMAAPLMHMAAWQANRLIYDKPRQARKILFLDENKYLEQTGAGRTLNLRIARDSRKFNVRALVCSQLPDDYLGVDGTDDKSALTYEVIIGDLGGNKHAIEGALKLLNLPAGQGYEATLADLGGGGEDTLDPDTDTSHVDQARRFMMKMADDIEIVRCDWTNFTHLAHVFQALDSRPRAGATIKSGGAP
ncbi:hypothetical protein XU06_30035 (plasmid) [Rhodococcus erythropolis]|uniref:ATP-binding protein n=1 Tax=Rhodococcus erythropolis TaxID=1833 RepID=UPI00061B73A4|nr:ATP-binding protein [Rhodococcus erythropolis]AKE01181.1 hypothetical protein XU06_30035 [Rhodococcus erythropolis]